MTVKINNSADMEDTLEQICVYSLGVQFPINRPNLGYLHFCGIDCGYGDDVKEDMLEDAFTVNE